MTGTPPEMSDDDYAAHLDKLEAEEQALRARLESPAALYGAAIWFARNGHPIFPLHNPVVLPADPIDGSARYACSCGQPCASPAKHPRTTNGLKDATTDTAQVAAWWTKWPQANIGLVTGVIYDVIDIDGPTGIASLTDLRHAACPADCCGHRICPGDGTTLPKLYGKAATPRGRHLYVAATGDGNRAGVLPGIDYRGVGGYVVAPPSRGMTGQRYFFTDALVDPQDDAA